MKRRVMVLTFAAAIVAGPGARADVQTSTEVREGISLAFAVPDWVEWPPDFQPCGPDPSYYFSFELERVTTTAPGAGPAETYRAGGGDGGCERGSGAYGQPVGPVVLDVDPIANAVHVDVRLGDYFSGACPCDHFEFTMTRPAATSASDCLASVVCPNAWIDPGAPAAAASLGAGFVRSGYEVTLIDYAFLDPDTEIREMDNQAFRMARLVATVAP